MEAAIVGKTNVTGRKKSRAPRGPSALAKKDQLLGPDFPECIEPGGGLRVKCFTNLASTSTIRW